MEKFAMLLTYLLLELANFVAGRKKCDLDILQSRIKELELNEEVYWKHLKLREYVSVMHKVASFNLKKALKLYFECLFYMQQKITLI